MAIQSVNNVIMVRATHADATTNDETFTLVRPGIAYDFLVISNNGGAGTVTLRNGAAAISSPLNPADVIDTVVRPADTGVWTAASKVLAAGSVSDLRGLGNDAELHGVLLHLPHSWLRGVR